jgi:hypothetical protein
VLKEIGVSSEAVDVEPPLGRKRPATEIHPKVAAVTTPESAEEPSLSRRPAPTQSTEAQDELPLELPRNVHRGHSANETLQQLPFIEHVIPCVLKNISPPAGWRLSNPDATLQAKRD